MKNKAIWRYLTQNVIWCVWSLWMYQNLLFSSVPGLTGNASLWLLRAMVGASVLAGFLLNCRKHPTDLNIFISIVCPVGIYYMLSLWTLERARIVTVMGWTCAVAVCYVALVVILYIKDRAAGMGARPLKCAFGCFRNVRTIIAFGMAVLLLSTSFDLLPMDFARRDAYSPPSYADPISHVELIEQNIDELVYLQPEDWEQLDLDQRLEVLRVAAQIECSHLGIPPVRVCAISLGENTLGSYNHSSRTVKMDLDHLVYDSVESVLQTVCHEVYHSYQHHLVDLYSTLEEQERDLRIFNGISDYAYEFENYIYSSGDIDTFYDYYYQSCEVDSNFFADISVETYYDVLSGYFE